MLKIFHLFTSLTREIVFNTLDKRNFVSPHSHVISSMYGLESCISLSCTTFRTICFSSLDNPAGNLNVRRIERVAFHSQLKVHEHIRHVQAILKDGAYYCYCAYVLRISRYSDFLSPMLTNTGIFLRGLKLSGKSRY